MMVGGEGFEPPTSSMSRWRSSICASRPRRGPLVVRRLGHAAGGADARVVEATNLGAAVAVEAALAELDLMPAVAGGMNPIAGGAPLVHGEMKSNVASSPATQFGDIGAAFAADSVVAKVSLRTERVAGGAMEPRCVTAGYDAETGGRKVCTSTQTS